VPGLRKSNSSSLAIEREKGFSFRSIRNYFPHFMGREALQPT